MSGSATVARFIVCQAEFIEAPSSLALRQAQCDNFDKLGGIPLGGNPLSQRGTV
jgi:hypothetical protein